MKKFSLLLLCCICMWPLRLFGEPFALATEGKTYTSLIGNIAQQKPVFLFVYDLNSPSSHLQHDERFFALAQESFTVWFKNVLTRIEPGSVQEKQIQPLLPAIRFGAEKQNYRYKRTGENLLIAFADTRTVRRRCGGAACVSNGILYIFYPENEKFESIFLHEIGHTLSLEDLYSQEYPVTAGTYGSGIQDSIMNESPTLTCDDADGIVNALYLAQKNLGLYPQEDFVFTSFCREDRTFLNAQMQNRKTQQTDYRGKRTIFTYCPQGPVHTLTEIDPRNPQTLYVHQVKNECANPSSSFATHTRYSFEDFLAHKPYPAEFPHHNEIVVDLPSYENPLKLTISHTAQFPLQAHITDSKGRTVFFFSRLDNEFNFVWDAPLGRGGTVMVNTKEGFQARSEASVYIYNRDNPNEYYIFQREHRQNEACSAKDPQCCQQMQEIAEKTLHAYQEKYNLLLPSGGWVLEYAQDNIKMAQKWEEFLQTNVPSFHLVTQNMKKAIEEELKKMTVKPLPLKR